MRWEPRTWPRLTEDPWGEIDFFGYKGIDLEAVRAALPFHEGDSFAPPKATSGGLKKRVGEAVEHVIDREPTDMSFVCCDAKQNFMVYIGLPGESYEALAFNPAPTGDVRFPNDAVKLVKQWMMPCGMPSWTGTPRRTIQRVMR